MSTKIYVLNRADGGVSIMEVLDGAEVAEEVAKWNTSPNGQLYGPCLSFHEINPATKPPRRFRDAHVWNGSALALNIQRARTLRKSELGGELQDALDQNAVNHAAALADGDNVKAAVVRALCVKLKAVVLDTVLAAKTTPADLDLVKLADLIV